MDELTAVRRFYDLLASGDGAAAMGLLHPDIEWTEAERTPYFAGTMCGVDAVVAGLFEPLARDFEDFTTVPLDFLHDGCRVASFGRYAGTAKSTGRAMSVPFVHLWTVEDGRLRRLTQFTDSAAWNEALAFRSKKSRSQTLDQRHEHAKRD